MHKTRLNLMAPGFFFVFFFYQSSTNGKVHKLSKGHDLGAHHATSKDGGGWYFKDFEKRIPQHPLDQKEKHV